MISAQDLAVPGRKVCILTTVHPPFDTRIFHKEAKTLVGAGYRVTLIAQHDGDVECDRIQIRGLPTPRNRFARMLGLSWRAFLMARRERADVYHFHDPELLPLGLLLKLTTGAKVIYDVHEDVPAQILGKHWIPGLLRKPVAFVVGMVEKVLAGMMNGVVVATETLAERFSRCDPAVVHNYPALDMLPAPAKRASPSEEQTLVYVGGISRPRGAFEMLRAVERAGLTRNVRLDLIGRYEPHTLSEELSRLPGYGRARFLGWLQPADIYRRLWQADVGLVCLHPVPRYVVALPVKLFEYMAAGLPVVASDFPLWKEIVEGNGCGLTVDPMDADAIAHAIGYLLDHPEEARRMGENGRRAVEEKYNWEREAQTLLGVCRQVQVGVP